MLKADLEKILKEKEEQIKQSHQTLKEKEEQIKQFHQKEEKRRTTEEKNKLKAEEENETVRVKNLEIDNEKLRQENEELNKKDNERKQSRWKNVRNCADRLLHYFGNILKAALLPLALYYILQKCTETSIAGYFNKTFINKTYTIKFSSFTVEHGISWPQSLAIITLIVATASVIILTIKAAADILKDD